MLTRPLNMYNTVRRLDPCIVVAANITAVTSPACSQDGSGICDSWWLLPMSKAVLCCFPGLHGLKLILGCLSAKDWLLCLNVRLLGIVLNGNV